MLRSSGDLSIRPNTPQLLATCKRARNALASAIFGATALLTACGGGGGGTTTSGVPSSPTLTGTAATGAALANASVAITNSAGNSPCTQAIITTSALGSYTCTLKIGETAPFFVVVTDPTGNIAPLVSVATTTPVAGTPLTVNATPLTTAILAQLASDGNPLTLVGTHTVNAADLQNVTAKVVTQLASVLTSVNAPAGYNPFSTSITAATSANTGNTADMILDVVKVVTDPATGKPALSTVSDPTPIVLATTTTTGTAVAAPSTGVATLSAVAQSAAQNFEACFADSQRVVSTTSPAPAASAGGPEVAAVSAACQYITATTTNGAGINFKHNGYSAGQFFYSELTSSIMTGAKFSVPEIMAYYPGDTVTYTNTEPAYYDRAVINIRYLDNQGNPGNKITVAARIPASGAPVGRSTDWWLVGNQQLADASVRPAIRRQQQFMGSGTPSMYFSGLIFNISATGPNSSLYDHVRITGDGLPSSGLWLKKNGNFMDVSNYRQATAGVSIAAPDDYNSVACTNCPLFWFGRTVGITGTDATTLTTNFTNKTWAASGDGSYVPFAGTGTRPKKGSPYLMEFFLGSVQNTSLTAKKVLLADVVPPEMGSQLPWNAPGTNTLGHLDETNMALNGTASTVAVDWTQNPSAQQIGSINLWLTASGNYDAAQNVPKGATSIVLTPATPIAAIPGNGTVKRAIIFNYRMLDGSYKSAAYSYK